MSKEVEIIGLRYETPDPSTEEKEAIQRQWKKLGEWFEKLPAQLKGARVYCEAFYVNQPKEDITEIELLPKEESLEKIVKKMLERGAEIEGTEDPFLHQLVGKLMKLGEIADRLPASETKKELMEKLEIVYDKAQKERDRFIAEQIEKTLSDGEGGFLFVGAGHEVEEFLPADIEVRTWWK